MGSKEIPEGFVGNLKPDQEEKLKEMWRKFFTYTEGGKAPVAGVKADASADAEKKGGGGGGGDAEAMGSAKDDDAKDKQKKEEEKKELSALLQKSSPEEFRERFWLFSRGENPDALMLRFIRARKWDVDRAFMMLSAAIKFRIDNKVDEIRTNGELVMCKEKGFSLQYDKGKSYINGTDKAGRPIVFIHVALHKPSEQSQDDLAKFVIFNMETARTLLTPENQQATLCFDMTGFGLKNMDWNCISFIVKCLEAYYPETLGLGLIHKAPFVFWGIWKILGPLLDPVVRSKVDFTRSEKDLFKHIDPNHVEKGMGGDLDWAWKYEGPSEGENDEQKDEEKKKKYIGAYEDCCKEWEEQTKKWMDGDKKAGEYRRNVLDSKILLAYYDSEPYARGKTTYTRRGICVGDGRVKWTYNGEEEVWGESMDKDREKCGMEGKCPLNDPKAAEEAAANKDEDEEEAAAAGAAGGAAAGGVLGKVKRKTKNTASKVTPGPSIEEKEEEEREKREAEKKKKQEELRKKKEEEEQTKKEEESKQEEQEQQQQSNGGSWLGSVQGYAGQAGSTIASGAGSAGSALYSGAGAAGSAAGSGASYAGGFMGGAVNSAGDYVPGFLGGNYMKQVPAPNSDYKSERAPGETGVRNGVASGA